jgi:hypothetical protein
VGSAANELVTLAMMDGSATIVRTFTTAAADLTPHRYTIIDALDDGTSIPVEALSEDHSVGVYGEVAPRKMREHADGYVEINLARLRPQTRLERTIAGWTQQSFLEYAPLRGVRFRAEELQYLEEGWDATLAEVKYPTTTVLALAHLVNEAYGDSARVYLHTALPMPLWIRAHPFDSSDVGVQFAIQVRAGNQMRPTNIHTECSMEYARRWVTAAHGYYDAVAEPR